MTSRRACTILIFAAAGMTACGTPPQKEMEQARSAIKSAESAGAGQYAPTELAAATDALTRSEAAVAQRDYRLALSSALEASEHAEDAAKAATALQATLRAEAERGLTALSTTIDRLKGAVAAAESARPPRQNRQAISDARRAVVVGNVALQKAREALGSHDYSAAKAACADALERLNSAEAALTKPPAAPSGQRPR
jgi:hypothetical protein